MEHTGRHPHAYPLRALRWSTDGSAELEWKPALATRVAQCCVEAGGTLRPVPKPNEAINPEWRLYARSAADDKAGVIAILSALDALRDSGMKPTSNLKFFFEGEEEAGSPHLA